MPNIALIQQKIGDAHFQQIIADCAQNFTPDENHLLHEILSQFDFDPLQTQALAQAVLQQSRFDPNANHLFTEDDDDETTAICQHCLNPPIPPLRDYEMWRNKTST